MTDFAPGDVVVCVDAKSPARRIGWHDDCAVQQALAFLVEGRSYRITFINTEGGLHLAGQPEFIGEMDGYWPDRFRKFNDGTDDAELIARIKSCKPVRERAPA